MNLHLLWHKFKNGRWFMETSFQEGCRITTRDCTNFPLFFPIVWFTRLILLGATVEFVNNQAIYCRGFPADAEMQVGCSVAHIQKKLIQEVVLTSDEPRLRGNLSSWGIIFEILTFTEVLSWCSILLYFLLICSLKILLKLVHIRCKICSMRLKFVIYFWKLDEFIFDFMIPVNYS